MSCRTNCCKTFLLIFALLAVAILATSAFAQNCLQDEYNKVNPQGLNCTANDVRVAEAINTRDLSGTTVASCTPGQTLNFFADFLVQTSSNKTRSNIGLYFATGDPTVQTQALTGSCSDNIIGPGRYTCSNKQELAGQCGSTHYDELDTSQFAADNCGDTSSTDPTVCLSAANASGNRSVVSCPAPAGGLTFTGTQVVTVEIDGLTCPNTPGQNVTLPNCTSWQVPGKAIQCISPSPFFPYPVDTNGIPSAIPGSPSKCNCATVTLPIIVQSPKIAVTKNCTTANGSSNFPTTKSCTLPDPGSSTTNNVTYTVAIDTSGTNFGDIAVDQVCDSAYGTVYRATGYNGAACAVNGSITSGNTTCDAATLGDVTSSGTSCTFQVFQAESTTVTNIVTVTGHGLSGGGTASGSSNVVNGSPTVITVTAGEDPTTGTITKAPEAITNACATVKYTTTVKNTSTAPEETLTLNTLLDDNVDLTTTGTYILSTTCNGGTGGAGALPKTLAANGTYTCEFTHQFCHAPQDVIKTVGTCVNNVCTTGNVTAASCSQSSDCDVHCTGIQATDTVTATLTGDENEVVSLAPGTATATMCVTGP